jgi:uncharacterized protein YjbI with pentapeptide repeats
MAPRLPVELTEASSAEHDLDDEAALWQLDFVDLDLAERSAESVECERCRFQNTNFEGTKLVRAAFTDCVFQRCSLANLRVEQSAIRRATWDSLRMTGMSWVGGLLRDVTVSDSRCDLTSFRFTKFHNVRFVGCNLTRADFENADLTGVWFTNCDLTSAQFSLATMTGVQITNCELSGIGGLTSLRGATIRGGDPVTLTHLLASALGIRLEFDC